MPPVSSPGRRVHCASTAGATLSGARDGEAKQRLLPLARGTDQTKLMVREIAVIKRSLRPKGSEAQGLRRRNAQLHSTAVRRGDLSDSGAKPASTELLTPARVHERAKTER